jgi:hypothetical protein
VLVLGYGDVNTCSTSARLPAPSMPSRRVRLQDIDVIKEM